MTQLSRLAILGIAHESTPGTYVLPTSFLPFTKADFEDNYSEIKDESYRGNDSVLQGLYQGPVTASWTVDMLAYPDLIGYFLASMIGPDQITAGVSTTLSSASSAGATSISVAASIGVGTYIQIDSGTNLEYAKVTAVSGTGPYTLTVTGANGGGLLYAHTSSATVLSQTTHTFKQAPPGPNPTMSFTVYDTLQTLSYSYAAMSDLQLKIDPKGAVTAQAKYTAMPGVVAASMTPTFTSVAPVLGWEWTMVNAGTQSTRGLSYDLNLKRPVDPIHSASGTQAARENFQGPLTADATYKAIFENMTDLNLYLQYSQQPTTATLQQPTAAGGASLALTMSKSGWVKGKRDWANYVEASFSLSGIYNTTDGGSVSAVLKNFRSTAF